MSAPRTQAGALLFELLEGDHNGLYNYARQQKVEELIGLVGDYVIDRLDERAREREAQAALDRYGDME